MHPCRCIQCLKQAVCDTGHLIQYEMPYPKSRAPGNSANSILESCCYTFYSTKLTNEERKYLEEKLYDGYYAFEAVTDRHWDQAICGICGLAPILKVVMATAKTALL